MFDKHAKEYARLVVRWWGRGELTGKSSIIVNNQRYTAFASADGTALGLRNEKNPNVVYAVIHRSTDGKHIGLMQATTFKYISVSDYLASANKLLAIHDTEDEYFNTLLIYVLEEYAKQVRG